MFMPLHRRLSFQVVCLFTCRVILVWRPDQLTLSLTGLHWYSYPVPNGSHSSCLNITNTIQKEKPSTNRAGEGQDLATVGKIQCNNLTSWITKTIFLHLMFFFLSGMMPSQPLTCSHLHGNHVSVSGIVTYESYSKSIAWDLSAEIFIDVMFSSFGFYPPSKTKCTNLFNWGKICQNLRKSFLVLQLLNFTVERPLTHNSQRWQRAGQTQLLAKWVRAAGMIAWIFKMKQLQTEVSVTTLLMPSSVKQWQHAVQLRLPPELLLRSCACTERERKQKDVEYKREGFR